MERMWLAVGVQSSSHRWCAAAVLQLQKIDNNPNPEQGHDVMCEWWGQRGAVRHMPCQGEALRENLIHHYQESNRGIEASCPWAVPTHAAMILSVYDAVPIFGHNSGRVRRAVFGVKRSSRYDCLVK